MIFALVSNVSRLRISIAQNSITYIMWRDQKLMSRIIIVSIRNVQN